MPASKNDIVSAIQEAEQKVDRLVSSLPEAAWSRQVYAGWTARELLAHLAATSGAAGFLLRMAKTPPGVGGGGGTPFDVDVWNAQQVGARQGKSIQDLLSEIRGNFQRDIEALRSAPVEVLDGHFRAPWGLEGALGDVILMAIRGHYEGHLADLRAATQ